MFLLSDIGVSFSPFNFFFFSKTLHESLLMKHESFITLVSSVFIYYMYLTQIQYDLCLKNRAE